MNEFIKTMLGEAATNYSELQITTALELATAEVEAYCNREVANDKILEMIVPQIAVIKLNRMGTESLASQSYSGVSESYISGYPAEIVAVLNRKRRIKVI